MPVISITNIFSQSSSKINTVVSVTWTQVFRKGFWSSWQQSLPNNVNLSTLLRRLEMCTLRVVQGIWKHLGRNFQLLITECEWSIQLIIVGFGFSAFEGCSQNCKRLYYFCVSVKDFIYFEFFRLKITILSTITFEHIQLWA